MRAESAQNSFRRSRREIASRLALLLLAFSIPAASALANRLVSASVGTRNRNSSLLVLKFDVPTQLTLGGREGRSIVLSGGSVQQGPESFHASGLIRNLRVQGGDIVVDATRYVRARMTSAGAGIYLIVLESAKEPANAQPQRATPSTPEVTKTGQQAQPAVERSEKPVKTALAEPEKEQPVERQETAPPPQVTPQTTEPSTPQTQEFQTYQPDLTQTQAGFRKTLADLYEWVPVHPVVLPTTVQFALELSQQGNRDRAILLLESIKPEEPEFGWSRIALGRMMEQVGDYNKALDYYREALSDRETEGVAAVRIALAFQAVGNRTASVGLWERVLDMNQGQIYVEPSEMPQPRAEPSSYAMQTPAEPVAISPQEPSTPTEQPPSTDTTAELNASAGKSGKAAEPKKNTFSFVRLWPFAIGFIALSALLYFVLSRLKKRPSAKEYDIHQDMANLGLDIELDEEPEPAAGPRVADMYAAQSGEAAPEPEEGVEQHEEKPAGEGEEEEQEDVQLNEIPEPNDLNIDTNDFDLSDDKVAQVREMHAQGATVREIAEELGIGQDEVRMAIRLAEAGQ